MEIFRIVNKSLHSNTYILYLPGYDGVWLVDCGDYSKIDEWLKKNNKYLVGILVTHSHYDHIYGIEEALKNYPSISVYISKEQGKEYMRDAKLNMSRYVETIVSIVSDNFVEISQGDEVQLWGNYKAEVIETPGHTPDCLSFIISNNIFTGDTYIPRQKMTARSKGGDKDKLKLSMTNIFNLIRLRNLTVCPGHNKIETAIEIKDDIECTIHIH